MRKVSVFAIIGCLAIAVHFSAQEKATGTIQGIVVRADTGEPLTGAQVALQPLGPIPGAPAERLPVDVTRPLTPRDVSTITTDGAGSFSFKALEAGGYRLAVTADRYAGQAYGQQTANVPGGLIPLAAGETLKGIVFRLMATGTVTGRVLDDTGSPATGVSVQLLRPAFSNRGKVYQAATTGTVDDRGEYRLYGVVPGRYYLVTGTPPGPLRPALNSATPDVFSYEWTFHPQVGDIELASPIEVGAGAEVLVNVAVKRRSGVFSVRGQVVDSVTGQPPDNFTARLLYSSSGGWGSFAQLIYSRATGMFELKNVQPGTYKLYVEQRPLAPPRALDAESNTKWEIDQASRRTAQIPIRVTDADIAGIMVTLRSQIVEGRVSVEEIALSRIPNLAQLKFAIIGYGANTAGDTLRPKAIPPKPDGTFQVFGIGEGTYRFDVSGTPPGFYVKSIQYGGKEIQGVPVEFAGSANSTISVVLRSGAAQLKGSVTGATTGNSLVQVVLIPEQRDRLDLYRTVLTDQTGRFSLLDVTPGDYRIFSWEGSTGNAFYDPEFVNQYERRSLLLHVAESSDQTVDVRVIPVQ